jgi:hypothetical protein
MGPVRHHHRFEATLLRAKKLQKVLVLFCFVCIIQLMGCRLLLYRASGQQGLEMKMTKTFKIDYRSGIESEQQGETAMDALRAEFSCAGADMPEVESTFSGGNWDFSVYDVAEPRHAFSTAYFAIIKNS